MIDPGRSRFLAAPVMASTASPSAMPGRRLNDSVTAGNWPWWLTESGCTLEVKCAKALIGSYDQAALPAFHDLAIVRADGESYCLQVGTGLQARHLSGDEGGRVRVAFQGAPHAYSQAAAQKYLAGRGLEGDLAGYRTFRDAARGFHAVMLGIGFCAEFGHHGAVDAHLAAADQFFGVTARSDSGAGDNFLQSFEHLFKKA